MSVSNLSLIAKLSYYISSFLKWIRKRLFGLDYIIAHLKDDRIIVQDVHLNGLKLWKQGFYGRGTLSRGAPTWATRMHLKDQAESLYQVKNAGKSLSNTKIDREEYVLSREEAFYLLVNDWIQIYDENVKSFRSKMQLWDIFSKGDCGYDDYQEFSCSFSIRYAVYQYYRNKKWVVRPGLKYGADYVLYRKGPSIDHSEYIVLIMVDNGDNYLNRNWKWVLRMSRLSSQVKKKLVCCFVVLPEDFIPSDLVQMNFLSKIVIWDLEISRWVPSLSL